MNPRIIRVVLIVVTSLACATVARAAADAANRCQRTIEGYGVHYTKRALKVVRTCAKSGSSISSCLATELPARLSSSRERWGKRAARHCRDVDVFRTLGYHATCGVAPSQCTFRASTLDAPGGANDLLDCLACRIQESVADIGPRLYADVSEEHACHSRIGAGGVRYTRALLGALFQCQLDKRTSIAECLSDDQVDDLLSDKRAIWTRKSRQACKSTNPISGSPGYAPFCSGGAPSTPGSCPRWVPACSFNPVSNVTQSGANNDLIDCLTCQTHEAALSVARDLFGVNLCCVGSECMTVRTRRACRAAGGTPAYHQSGTVLSGYLSGPHGVAAGADGSVYVADSNGYRVQKVDPLGITTTVWSGGWTSGVAVDDATGDVLVNLRCEDRVLRVTPGGSVSTFAGTGSSQGPAGNGGPATSATVVAPNRVVTDGAGNAYITESGFLHAVCGPIVGGRENLRRIDSNGDIHPFAGNGFGSNGEGGPATSAGLGIPYAVRIAPDGGVIIGEAGLHRVVRVDPVTGVLTRVAGIPSTIFGSYSGDGGPAVRARLYEACGVAPAPGGAVYIADMVNNRVRFVDRLGSITTVAGTGFGFQPHVDGIPAIHSDFGCPEDVVVGPDGLAYVASITGNRIGTLEVVNY